jgi:two-component system KDP operon response regulator KdpE
MTKATILLIDDDETLLELLSGHLYPAGYLPLVASNGPQGLQLAAEKTPDLVVLDVMMSGMDGWEVCKQLRKVSTVPIIMLTAKGDEFDKLHGFRLGVDDYVTKPFSFAELVARIGAVLSRVRRVQEIERQVHIGELAINFEQRRVTVAGHVIDLTPTEYRLLGILARHAHRTLPTEQLLTEVWGAAYQGEPEHVKRYIWSLRQKIETDPGNPQHILTERGFGYRLE